MKKLVTMVFLMMAVGSQASYIQNNCSNSDSSVKISMGHSKSGITISAFNIIPRGSVKEVQYDHQDLEVIVLDSTEISSESTVPCQQGSHGYGESTTVELQKVKIVKRDGSEFLKGTIGLSKDQKSITDYIVCKRYSNYRAYCPSEE